MQSTAKIVTVGRSLFHFPSHSFSQRFAAMIWCVIAQFWASLTHVQTHTHTHTRTHTHAHTHTHMHTHKHTHTRTHTHTHTCTHTTFRVTKAVHERSLPPSCPTPSPLAPSDPLMLSPTAEQPYLFALELPPTPTGLLGVCVCV